MNLIVGISGATGVIMGYYLLKVLKNKPDITVHLVLSEGAVENFRIETNLKIEEIKSLADYNYDNKNLAAKISSGSYKTDGMIVLPCSMKTLSGVANGFATNLLLRSVDVCLKESRKVVLVPREMPMSRIHINNMARAAEYGCTIIPPVLTFYNGANSLEKQISHVIGKILMQFNIEHDDFVAWKGL